MLFPRPHHRFIERFQQKWTHFCGSETRQNKEAENFRGSRKSGYASAPRFRPTARLGALAALLAATLTGPVTAFELRENATDVVELFTSQGCSSCPEADRLLAALAAREGVVALAYHVDYWDYAGWEDTFARSAHTDHQRAYAQAWGKSRIYTPQMVVNGVQGVVGSRAGEVDAALSATGLTLPVTLETEEGDILTFRAGPNPELQSATVWLVTFRSQAEVEIERGENSGRRLVHTHVVTDRRALGLWDPARGAEIRLPLAQVLDGDSDGLALIVQEKQGILPGRILGAASLLR